MRVKGFGRISGKWKSSLLARITLSWSQKQNICNPYTWCSNRFSYKDV